MNRDSGSILGEITAIVLAGIVADFRDLFRLLRIRYSQEAWIEDHQWITPPEALALLQVVGPQAWQWRLVPQVRSFLEERIAAEIPRSVALRPTRIT